MKYRLDQVTNSSSSSFVCDVCGSVETGWDISLSDAEMYKCVNGHIFCESHADLSDKKALAIELIKTELQVIKNSYWINEERKNIQYEEINNSLKEIQEGVANLDDVLSDYNLRERVPAKFCPICSHSYIRDSEGLEFALSKLGISKEELYSEMRKNFAEEE